MAGTRLLFTAAMLRVSPPWLRRLVGGAIMESLGVPVETEVDRNVEGVELRFPGDGTSIVADPDALGLIGRSRRILRGPGESDTTFGLRLRKWWDAHRTRGNAHALLQQMYDFFVENNPLAIQYIANSGTTVSIDIAGAFSAVGDVAGWGGDGEYPTKWARFFLVLFFPGDTLTVPLFTEDGLPVLTEAGEQVLVDSSLTALTATDIELICSVPREWSAAHVDRIYLIVVPDGGYAWGVPETLAWGDVGKTWGEGATTSITC